MRVLAYCAAQFKASTRRASGVEPSTCPPQMAGGPLSLPVGPLAMLDGGDGRLRLLYLALHGRPGEDTLYGDEGIPALTADQVRAWDLAECTVFAATCYLPETPFLAAFTRAGAVVIAGRGPNFSPARSLAGASLLGRWVRRGLAWGLPPRAALALGKARVAVQLGNRAAARDALEFQLYT